MTAKRILVPLDGRESSEAAAALAADLARSSGGTVRLLQVHPVPAQRMGTFGRVVAYADQEMARQDRVHAQERPRAEIPRTIREREGQLEIVVAEGVAEVEPGLGSVGAKELAAQDAGDQHRARHSVRKLP